LFLGLKEGSNLGGFKTAEDVFMHFFGGGPQFGRSRGKKRGEDIVQPLDVTLEDLYLGRSFRLAVKKNILCTECQGRGRKQSSVASECRSCRGTGQKITLRQLGPNLVQQLQMHCTDCNGTGEHILPSDRCLKCNGQQILIERKILTVNIDKGMAHKQRITFTAEADEGVCHVSVDFLHNIYSHLVSAARSASWRRGTGFAAETA